MKNDVYFHLYISEFPCGDSSISFNSSEQSNTSTLTGSKSISEVNKLFTEFNKTDSNKYSKLEIQDSQPFDYTSEKKCILNHNNNLGCFRIKSCRTDTKLDNISLSLSCSDKIMFNNFFGIQGKRLFDITGALYLNTITISNTNKDYSENNLFRGLTLQGRSDYNSDIKTKFINNSKQNFNFNIINAYFSNTIPQFLLTNNTFFYNSNRTNKSITNSNLALYWYFPKLSFTKIEPSLGLKQGTNKNQKNLLNCKVDICLYDLCFSFIDLLNVYSNSGLNIEMINRVINKVNKFKSVVKENEVNGDNIEDCIDNCKDIISKDDKTRSEINVNKNIQNLSESSNELRKLKLVQFINNDSIFDNEYIKVKRLMRGEFGLGDFYEIKKNIM